MRGSVVLITGGARGIGAATAALFAEHGARVWIGDVDEDACLRTAADIGVRGARLDVTSMPSWRELLSRIDSQDGPLDILVNNAGVMPLGALDAESEQIRDLTLDVNVRGVLNGMQAVLGPMARRGRGQVINVASMAGMIPIPGMVTYNASKFAALGASLAARQEYAGTGVAVTAVLPSAVRTELSSGARLGGGMPTVDASDVAAAQHGDDLRSGGSPLQDIEILWLTACLSAERGQGGDCPRAADGAAAADDQRLPGHRTPPVISSVTVRLAWACRLIRSR